MAECMMVLAYFPWVRCHADRVLRKTLRRTRKRTRKGRAHRPRESESCGHANAVFSE